MDIELTPSGPETARPRGRAYTASLLALAVLPLAFVHYLAFGLRLSGWAWLITAVVITPVVLFEPLRPRAVRAMLLYLLYAAYALLTLLWAPDLVQAGLTYMQVVLFALVYLLAWRIRDVPRFLRALPPAALYGIGMGSLITLVSLGGRRLVGPLEMSVRPTAMGLVILFILAGIRIRSWRLLTVISAITFAIILFTGSRMAAAALIPVLLTHPSLMANRPRWLTIVSGLILTVLAVSNTQAFQERFFFSEDASLRDVITLSDNLNTAGRRELWPALLSECSAAPVLGNGVGAGAVLSTELTDEVLGHPHNEFIRVYCDTGLIGTVLLWGFFLTVAVRNYHALRHGGDTRLHTAALQCVAVLVVLAVTDNPLVYTALFMTPFALVLGLADHADALRRRADPPLPSPTEPVAARAR
jgi:O-antigen ligase